MRRHAVILLWLHIIEVYLIFTHYMWCGLVSCHVVSFTQQFVDAVQSAKNGRKSFLQRNFTPSDPPLSEADTARMTMTEEEFRKIIFSGNVCAWGECYRRRD